MTQMQDVADYLIKMSRESNSAVSNAEIAEALGIRKSTVSAIRTTLTRTRDDICPIEVGAMVYEPGWREKYPDIWATAQARTNAVKNGQANSPKMKRPMSLPNVVGPILTIHNVVAVNVHPDHIAIQHVDGSWTEFTGKLKMKGKQHG